MKWHYSILKQILSGIIFLLLPVTILILILGKAISLVKMVLNPLKDILPADRVLGVGWLGLISFLLIFLICYLAGALVENKMIRAAIKLEDRVLVFIPGYSMLLQRAGDIVSEKEDLRVVLLNEDDEWRPGIEIEQHENGFSSIFFPGPPAGRTGFLKIVHRSKLKILHITVLELMKIVRKYGKGSAHLATELT
jgi:uncharacterized membrane protein